MPSWDLRAGIDTAKQHMHLTLCECKILYSTFGNETHGTQKKLRKATGHLKSSTNDYGLKELNKGKRKQKITFPPS